MSDAEKITAAQRHVAEKMADIIIKNYDQTGAALETAGTFTALLEAYKATEIALKHLPRDNAQHLTGTYGNQR